MCLIIQQRLTLVDSKGENLLSQTILHLNLTWLCEERTQPSQCPGISKLAVFSTL